MVREGEISPVELVEAHLRQIGRQNPRLNAFTAVFEEEARAAARAAESQVARGEPLGMLHGVPVTVKDSFDMEGAATACGSRFRLHHRAARDATAVARLRAEGAIILGKTNTPELLASYETDNHVTGRTNNPWDMRRTPGGSSGGEAAAIAALCSPGGLGSDGGGSIRVPAHFCGIAGLKPTPGRISMAGHFPTWHAAGWITAAGPMARNAEDLRLLFAALAGYDPRDPLSAPAPLRKMPAAGLRVGLAPRFGDVPVQPEIAAAVDCAAGLLASAGFQVEPWEPAGISRAPNLWWFFFGQLPAPFTRQLFQGREADAHWTATESLDRALRDPAPTAEDVVAALAARDAMRTALLAQMENLPLLLMPACGITAFEHRARRWPAGGREIGLFQALMPALPWNLLGFPAAALPVAVTADGLPAGVQLVGRPWEDELLLDAAVALENVRGPFAGPIL